MILSSHHKRLLTALLPLPLLLWVLFHGGTPLLLLILLLSALGQWEFYSMFWPHERIAWKLAGIGVGSLFLLTAGLGLEPLLALALAFCLFSLVFLVAYSRAPENCDFRQVQTLFLGCCYVPLLLHLALGFFWPELLLVIAAAFVSDTAAFYAGSSWGKTRIWPAISPKKTWIGSVAGLAACMLACLVIGKIWGQAGVLPLLGLGLTLNLAAQSGDFFESALKRSREIKDSGTILPGHGGLLDRIDSLLFVLPAYALLRLFHPFFG
ncbi:MAG TPA: phosphatidate cytidylyltransferase [Desulfonatronum sp.]|nr:phosphatidate cytidylyltransferase [Desulfonatronum sp.]